MKKCKVCGDLTDSVFNINLKATPICEECARRIFLQQATWYTQQEFKNLVLPHVMPSLSKELVIKILEKRLMDAFANQYHRSEDARLQEAIETIEALVPPSCFTN